MGTFGRPPPYWEPPPPPISNNSLPYWQPPPPAQSNFINDMIQGSLMAYFTILMEATSALLVVLTLWHVAQAFSKRLWLLPSHTSRLLALNAGTLALLGIMAKPAKPGDDKKLESNEYVMLIYTVLICSVIGAFMPSAAASTDLSDMWSNVVGVGLLIISTNFVIFLQLFYLPEGSLPNIHATALEHILVMASSFFILLVLLMQAMALEAMMSDAKAIVLEQLEKLRMEVKPGFRYNAMAERPWSWEVVEHNAQTKLMMILTSNPQNVAARSPATSIVGALVLFCISILLIKVKVLLFWVWFQGPAILMCGFINVWRWARVALQEDRPFLSLISDSEPSYWCRKVNSLCRTLKAGPQGAQPNVLEEGQYSFKEVFCYTTAFLMMCFIIPVQRVLVAMTRFTHILSALLMQKLIWLPVKALGCGVSIVMKWILGKRLVNTTTDSSCFFDSQLGVVCLEGEDPRIVCREFAGAGNLIFQRQLKRSNKSDLKALVSLLQTSKHWSSPAWRSTGILDVLNQGGAPYVENMHVEHGYQYGWSLTIFSLLAIMTKIEVIALEMSEMSEAAMTACWQALEMMQIVDEQFVPCLVCSKETYASASALEWSKLRKKRRRRCSRRRNQVRMEVKLDAVDRVLQDILEPLEGQMAEFGKTKGAMPNGIPAAWSQQTVASYTMYTVCKNLLRWWTSLNIATIASRTGGGGGEGQTASEIIIKVMVEHINALVAEVLACCLSNLPAALDLSMTEAVLSGHMTKIEKGLFLVYQGKRLWTKLQWPVVIHSPPTNTGFGQLRQWIHSSNYACAT